MGRWLGGVAGGGALGMAALTGGCALILGLDEFTDQPAAGEGCTSVADCPAGEHGSTTCEGGVCGYACEAGFADCDPEAAGCETNTTTDKNHCGGCGVACAAYCVDGTCNDPVYLAAGAAHACAILMDGSLWCWGAVPGPGTPGTELEIRTQPMRVDLPDRAIRVSVGGVGVVDAIGYVGNTCAVVADGTLYCWGTNDEGQLGVGDTAFRETPTKVMLDPVEDVSLGLSHTCAVDKSNQLFCWGNNTGGKIGDGTTTPKLTPVVVATSVAHVATGGFHTCAVKLGGSLQCWGLNAVGEVGNGSSVEQPLPVEVATGAIQVACGGGHVCARVSFGLACWGFNANGELGLNSTTNQDVPNGVGLAMVDAIFAGTYNSAALVGDDVYMWGDNSSGQVSADNATDVLYPTKIDLREVESLALGTGFSCGLTTAHRAVCWGKNLYGQLGDGTLTTRPNPGPVVWP